MSRSDRIIYEGAIYHIYQRGNNKEYIFQDDKIKSFILKWLKEYNIKFDYEVLAYVIMNNHYHLLLKTNKSQINEIMFYLNNLLGKYINNKLNRTGHAFEGRYKCRLVDSEAYLIWLLRYIHRNPIKANLCRELDEYIWSSHYFYKNNISSNVNSEFILSMLGSNKEIAKKRYLELLDSNGDEINKDKDYDIIKGIFNLKEKTVLTNIQDVNTTIKSSRKTLDEIILSLNIYKDTLESIRNGCKKQYLTESKIRIIKAALEEYYSSKEIANFLNVVPSAISKILSRSATHMTSDKLL